MPTIYLSCIHTGQIQQSSGVYLHCGSAYVEMCKAAAPALLIGSRKGLVGETLVGITNMSEYILAKVYTFA